MEEVVKRARLERDAIRLGRWLRSLSFYVLCFVNRYFVLRSNILFFSTATSRDLIRWQVQQLSPAISNFHLIFLWIFCIMKRTSRYSSVRSIKIWLPSAPVDDSSSPIRSPPGFPTRLGFRPLSSSASSCVSFDVCKHFELPNLQNTNPGKTLVH